MKNTQSNPETKKFVGVAAAQLIKDGMVAGIGTGSTMVFLIEELARRVRTEGMKITGVPTSFASRLLCRKLGIPVAEMGDVASLDIAIDGADEVDPNLDVIKGGGAAHTREKITAAMAKEFVVIVDESKLVQQLGTTFAIPVEVLPMGLTFVEKAIRDLGGDPALRMGVRKDGPVITDNGQLLFDAKFPAGADYRAIDRKLHATPGVVETGLFFDLAKKVLVGCQGAAGLELKTLVRK
jgi:ribose 5-phosphate isomerase A